ncbi:MAG: ATP-binding protein [Candidatus Cloacimonas sp.]|jgi:signal transduction histidine kinase|nr:ATP-binding protein [Candidatus Cloacimonas sp.]
MRRSTAQRRRNAPKTVPKTANTKDYKAMSESIIQAKSAFIGNISHEIRTPMNAIMGFAQMLQNTPLNEAQADYVNVIIDSGKKLLLIISNLLDLSNLQLGKNSLDLKPCHPRTISDKLWQHFQPLITAKRLNPVFECDAAIPELNLDCDKVERVVSFILSNAIKYTETGFVALKTSFKRLNDNEVTLIVEIADSGIGISEDKLPHIFDVFEQADNSITRRYSGLGIGLGLSRQIVVLLGGKIRVQSVVDEGSRFFIEIPATIPKAKS